MSIDVDVAGGFPELLDEMGYIVGGFILGVLRERKLSAEMPAGEKGLMVARGVAERVCDAISQKAHEMVEKEWADEHGIEASTDVCLDEQPAGQYVN